MGERMKPDVSEFRRGGAVLFAAALGTAFGASPLPFNSIGPFTKPLAEEFGWGRGDIQLALFCFTAAVVLTVPYVGGLADRIGVRKVALGTLFVVTFYNDVLLVSTAHSDFKTAALYGGVKLVVDTRNLMAPLGFGAPGAPGPEVFRA